MDRYTAERLHRLNALFTLTARYSSDAGSSGRELLAETLEILCRTTGALAGAAYQMEAPPYQVEAQGFGDDASSGVLKQALELLVERARPGRPIFVPDLMRDRAAAHKLQPLVDLGCACAVAQPIALKRETLGAFVVLFQTSAQVTPELMSFIQTVAQTCALALQLGDDDEQGTLDGDDARRMASLGLLTASVAHELRSPAGALLLQIDELRRVQQQFKELDRHQDPVLEAVLGDFSELVDDMAAATMRVRDTVEQLSTVSRRDSEPSEVDLSETVRDSLAIARPHLERRGVELHAKLDSGCFTSGRRDNLSQVVLNLVLNAADAALTGGHRPAWIRVETECTARNVALVVKDNGPGVPPESVKTIFKPFYTTKRRGEATGLGLKICSDVVTAHGGHIEVHNRPEGGACFRVLLPRATDESGMYRVRKVEEPVTAENEIVHRRVILLVDDDPIFTRTLRRALRGHEVVTAASASEAEIALAADGFAPDLILCDIALPGVNGHILHQRVTELDPELAARFVFVTGGALSEHEAEYLRETGCRTLFKPLDLGDLHRLLQEGAGGNLDNSVRTLAADAARLFALAK